MANILQLLSDEGYRLDGRKVKEIRKFNCKLGVFEQADGSAYVEMGNTKVLAAVYGPHDFRTNKSKNLHDQAFINCRYSIATFSTNERKKKSKIDFRSIEITNSLKEIFDSAILTNLYPHSQIDIYLEVLQSDGSNLSACVNAATLAIIHAGIPIKDIVCACSAGLINGTPITDVNYQEESIGITPTITIALLPKDKQILAVEETGRIEVQNLNLLIDLAMTGCQDIYLLMKSTILEFVVELNE